MATIGEDAGRLDNKKRRRIVHDESRWVQFGDLVTIEGRLNMFRDERQVNISTLFLEKDPNVESYHWIRTIHLRKYVYGNKP